MKLIWADKIVLFSWGFLIAVELFVGDPHYSYSIYNDPLKALGWAKIFLPLWLILRVLDLVSGGPSRRAGRISARWEN